MSANEILVTIKQLPLTEQKRILESLSRSISETSDDEEASREAEVERLLLAKGLLTEIPDGLSDEDDFEPIEVIGKPLSETIIEERR